MQVHMTCMSGVVLYRLADGKMQSSTLPHSPTFLLQEQHSRLRAAWKDACCQTEASWGAEPGHLQLQAGPPEPEGDTQSPPSASRSTSAGASSASLRDAVAGGLARSAASPGSSVDGCSWGKFGPSAAGSPARSSVSSLSLTFSLARASPGAACVPMLDLTTPRLITATGAANEGSSNGGSVAQGWLLLSRLCRLCTLRHCPKPTRCSQRQTHVKLSAPGKGVPTSCPWLLLSTRMRAGVLLQLSCLVQRRAPWGGPGAPSMGASGQRETAPPGSRVAAEWSLHLPQLGMAQGHVR